MPSDYFTQNYYGDRPIDYDEEKAPEKTDTIRLTMENPLNLCILVTYTDNNWKSLRWRWEIWNSSTKKSGELVLLKRWEHGCTTSKKKAEAIALGKVKKILKPYQEKKSLHFKMPAILSRLEI